MQTPASSDTPFVFVHHWAVPWFGEQVLGLAEPITVRPNGSGDTTYNYVQVLLMQTLAGGSSLNFRLLSPERLELSSPTGAFRVTLKKIDHQQFLLLKRGFHWINEYPYNR